MSVPGLYEPSAVQLEAHNFQPTPRVEILYGGAGGGGKTFWLRWDPVETQWAVEHQRWCAAREDGRLFKSTGWALHVRREIPRLLQTILYVREFAEAIDPGVKWDGDNKLLTFTCGYRYQFGHVEHPEDWRRYGSQDYTWLGLDESIEILKEQFDGLRLRVRSADPVLGQRLRVCLASNPDAPFEGLWVKERFVDPAPSGRKVLQATYELEDGTSETISRIYIPAYLRDNPDKKFVRDYEVQLRDMPRHIMMARLFARWDSVEGAFFEYEWIPDVHIVKPIEIPPHWPVYRVMDWGYKTACVVMYFTIDEEGNIIVIDELTWNHKCRDGERKDIEEVAIAIKKYEKAHDAEQEIRDAARGDGVKSVRYWNHRQNCSNLTGPADYQIREQRGNKGQTMEETMAAYGIYWIPCKKNRLQATAELLRRLKDIPKSKFSRPGFTVFDTCVNLARTMPTRQKTKQKDPTGRSLEAPAEAEDDHWFDCACYICLYRASPADQRKSKYDDEDEKDDLERARVKRAQGKWGYGS